MLYTLICFMTSVSLSLIRASIINNILVHSYSSNPFGSEVNFFTVLATV